MSSQYKIQFNMPSVNKKPVVKKQSAKEKAEVRDFSKDPVFVKKAELSKAFLEKHGFPKELLEKK